MAERPVRRLATAASHARRLMPNPAAAFRKLRDETPFLYAALLMLARTLPVGTIYIANAALPDAAFGSLAVLITSMNVASLVADSGTDNAAGWSASHARTEQEANRILSALLYTRVIVAVVATIVLIAPQAHYIPASDLSRLIIVIYAVLGSGLASLNGAKRIRLRISGAGEPKALIIEKLVLSLTFGLWILLAPRTAIWITWGYFASNLLGPAVAMQRLQRSDFESSIKDILRLLKSAAPFILTTLCAAVTWRASTFLLASHGRLDQAGYLALAYYPVQFLGTIPALSAPLLLIKRSSNAVSMRGTAYVAVAVGSGLSAICLIATEVVRYSSLRSHISGDALTALQILLVAAPFLWLNPILVSHLRLTTTVWRPTVVPIASALVAFGLAVAFVPSHGAPAAAAVIGVAEGLNCLGLVALVLLGRRSAPTAAHVPSEV